MFNKIFNDFFEIVSPVNFYLFINDSSAPSFVIRASTINIQANPLPLVDPVVKLTGMMIRPRSDVM